MFLSSHMHMLICIIIFPIAPCSTTFRPVPACAFLCHLYVCVVQMHVGFTSHAEAIQMTFNLSRLRTVSWWTCCPPATSPPHPTELAMLSTHSTHLAEKITHRKAEAGRTLCCQFSSCL